ncbi:MAG: C39 family peptidase [Deltaproteobacteria bacterium]|nr:C39 family peptidase [Deltaproteobacteria bacterium]
MCLLAVSCSGPGRSALLKDSSAAMAAGSYIKGVPFFPQNEYMCGPAALASVVGYWGEKAGMRDVEKEVYEEKLKGTLPLDLFIYAKEKGFDAVYYKGSMADLREKIRGGTPLILFLNLGYEIYPVGHYIVAIGYDDKSKAVIAHSGMTEEDVFTYDELLKSWGKTGFSTLLVRPKGPTR